MRKVAVIPAVLLTVLCTLTGCKKEEKQQKLLGFFEEKDGALLYRYDAERLRIEPWGENSRR